MSVDRSIHYIIEGAPIETQIDYLIYESVWDRIKGKLKWAVGATAVAGAAAYGYKRLSGNCNSTLIRLIAWALSESWRIGSGAAIDILVDIAHELVVSVVGRQKAVIVKSSIRRGLNILRRRFERGIMPTKAELKKIAKEALDAEMPRPLEGKAKLAAAREQLTNQGSGGWWKIPPGPQAYETWLRNRYNEGVSMKLPLCLLILLWSGDAKVEGAAGYEHLRGVGEDVLQAEFKDVLGETYPKFEI